MSIFAVGKKAYGFCDRCDFRYKLSRLKEEVINDTRTGILVCPVCWDPDHPQLHLDEANTPEGIGLRNPRPDRGEDESRRLYGFDPVGGSSSQMRLKLGTIKVVIT